jgi:DNA-directed RNA polymerase subunit L
MDSIEIINDITLELEVIVHNESHGICNALRNKLMKNKDVEYAVYNIDHPLIGEPIMTIKTKRGKRPKKVLVKAAKDLNKDISEFKSLVEGI